jgi:hypothetical protein
MLIQVQDDQSGNDFNVKEEISKLKQLVDSLAVEDLQRLDGQLRELYQFLCETMRRVMLAIKEEKIANTKKALGKILLDTGLSFHRIRVDDMSFKLNDSRVLEPEPFPDDDIPF